MGRTSITVKEKADYSKNEVTFEQRERDIRAEEQRERELLEREKKSPFKRFYQINKEYSNELIWLVKENPNAYRILLFLFDQMDNYNSVMCSYTVMQELLEISRTTAARAVKLLKEKGFIYVYKSGTSNVYVANPDIVWNSWGNNKKYCKFPTNIILSASEQENIKLEKEKINSININKKNSQKSSNNAHK